MIDNALEEFKNYTDNYLEYGDMINLKINHTHRVITLCGKIAKSIKLSKKEVDISKLIGLLHDIGRFEQYKKYKTYNDKKSVDHASLGVEILRKDDYLRKYIENDKYDKIILNSIKYHNKYTIPSNLDEKTMIFAKLIRDADKIDILNIYNSKEIEFEVEDNSFNESIYNSLINRKSINRDLIKTKTDRLAVPLGFVFDINYKESFNILKNKKYLNSLIDTYIKKTKNSELKEQLEEIRKVINNYIEVNLC